MVSKTLVKLIDQAIVPAIALLCTRLVSVVLLSKRLGIELVVNSQGFTFPTRESYILINSYSTLFMIIMLCFGLFYVLLKALVFHETHITPHLTAKLFTLRLSSFIQSSFDLYSQGIIWLAYTYLATTVAGVFAIFGLIYVWVFYTALVLSLFATSILVFDIENEMYIKKVKDDYIEDDSIVDSTKLGFGENNE